MVMSLCACAAFYSIGMEEDRGDEKEGYRDHEGAPEKPGDQAREADAGRPARRGGEAARRTQRRESR